MPDESIYILSGGIKTGKTTKLREFSEKSDNVYGILTPLIDGKRFFMDAHTNEHFPMEIDNDSGLGLRVGKYLFDLDSFNKAKAIIRSALHHKYGWLIIDEIGPLELNKDGFYDVVTEIIISRPKLKMLFVIRDTILHKAIDFFKLNFSSVQVIDTSSNILNT